MRVYDEKMLAVRLSEGFTLSEALTNPVFYVGARLQVAPPGVGIELGRVQPDF